MAKRASAHLVKIHRSYTVDDAARLLGVSKGTVRRWLKNGLPAMQDRRPHLILGPELIRFLDGQRTPTRKCEPHQCFCFKCRAPSDPALAELEYRPSNPTTGQLTALCERCSTVMHKAASPRVLASIGDQFTVRWMQGCEPLIDGAKPRVNDHLQRKG